MNEYPDGKIRDDDEGELKIKALIENGRVIIDFGKSLSWIGFDKESLRRFISILRDKYGHL